MTKQLQSILNDNTLLLLRYIVVGFNALMGVLAIVLAISVLSVHPAESNYNNLMNRSVFTSPYWLVLTGVLLLVAAGVSFYCAYAETLYGILGYLVFMVVIYFMEIVFGITLRYESKEGFQKNMEDSMWKYISDYVPWDKIQTELKCCGTNSPKDWFPIIGDQSLPSSCCPYTKTSPWGETLCRYNTSPIRVYQSGCFDKAFETIGKTVFDHLLSLIIVLQIVQLLNILFVTIWVYMLWKKDNIGPYWSSDPIPPPT